MRPYADRRPSTAAAGSARERVLDHSLVVGQQRAGQLLDHVDDLGVLLGIPPLEQLGQPVAPGLGQPVHGGQPRRRQGQVALVAALSPRPPCRPRPTPARPGSMISGVDLQALGHLVHGARRSIRQPVEQPAGLRAAGRCRPAAPASGTARPGSPGWRTAPGPTGSPAATTATRACPKPSPTSTVATVLRSGTSGRSQLSRKAKKAMGTATRKTVCTDAVMPAMTLS